jgi:hypothetical protein
MDQFEYLLLYFHNDTCDFFLLLWCLLLVICFPAEYCLPLVRVGGMFVAAKGHDPEVCNGC